MVCKDCDRFSDCKYKINSPIWSEAARGIERYISGKDCPKDWQDKKVEDMTEEQCREAVKELRGKLLTENKSAEENMAHEETTDRTTSYKPIYIKPPLGCMPSWISSCERIKELSEAITRNINGVHTDTSYVKKWATEILYHCEIMEKC